jgi:hypothetical protein
MPGMVRLSAKSSSMRLASGCSPRESLDNTRTKKRPRAVNVPVRLTSVLRKSFSSASASSYVSGTLYTGRHYSTKFERMCASRKSINALTCARLKVCRC